MNTESHRAVENNPLCGYTEIIRNALTPLNASEEFKKKFGAAKKIFMIDSPHWKLAARLTINKGTVLVEGIEKSPDEIFLRNKLQCDASVELPVLDLLLLVSGYLSPMGLMIRVIKGTIKIRGFFNLMAFMRVLTVFKNANR